MSEGVCVERGGGPVEAVVATPQTEEVFDRIGPQAFPSHPKTELLIVELLPPQAVEAVQHSVFPIGHLAFEPVHEHVADRAGESKNRIPSRCGSAFGGGF
jgi:hypothetical protein